MTTTALRSNNVAPPHLSLCNYRPWAVCHASMMAATCGSGSSLTNVSLLCCHSLVGWGDVLKWLKIGHIGTHELSQ